MSTSDAMDRGLAAHAGQLVDLNATRIAVRLAGYRAEFLNWGYFAARPWRNYPHSHSFFEICFAYSGRGTFVNRDLAHQVQAGDLFVARPGELHQIISDDTEPLGIYFWAHTLLPEPSVPGDGVDDGSDLLRAFRDPNGRLRSSRTGSIRALLQLLDREAGTPEPGMRESASALASALVLATARAVLDTTSVLQNTLLLPGADDLVGRRGAAAARSMIRYLHDNYERELVVRDVAAQVHMSERHASRLFRQATGTSIRAYLQRLRLEVAASRLAERELSVKEVAHSCGYSDVRHFTTAFRRQYDVTPAAFRQQDGTRFSDPSPE
jgi:AraC family L-rhamnose operon transcriptional activator RhaR